MLDSLEEASKIIKDISLTKFDASVDIDVRLGVDPKKADQMVRGAVFLPHGTGKKLTVLALCTPEKEDEAKEVIKKLAGGAKFEDLAKEHSIGPTGKNGGDLGFFTKDMMVPEFADATFDLKAGTYTKEPVKTKFGWHVVKLVEKRDRPVPKLEDIEQAIRQQELQSLKQVAKMVMEGDFTIGKTYGL